jgi:hypothetical protein
MGLRGLPGIGPKYILHVNICKFQAESEMCNKSSP